MFYEYLKQNDLEDLLCKLDYDPPSFSNENKVFMYLYDIVKNKRRVLIEGDYDVDGLMCVLIMKEMFDILQVNTYDVFKYRLKTHSIDKYAMFQCIPGHYVYFIVTDTGSSELDIVQQICATGTRVIILDHHNTKLDYSDFPSNCAIVNTILENRILLYDKFALSAGALCFCVADKFCRTYFDFSLLSQSAYALTSLYADCMDMSNRLNRTIYWLATGLKLNAVPSYIRHFMNDYVVFGRRYIEYWYAPRINSLFRSDNTELINTYFFDTDKSVVKSKCIETINKLYESERELVYKISDIVTVQELNNFVQADLESVDDFIPVKENHLYNYTGLIANKLADRYGKTAIVYCSTSEFYKGSVRDKYNRNYLSTFQQFCYAGGHNSAFGFRVNLFDLDKFLKVTQRIDLYYADKTSLNLPIIEQYDLAEPDTQLINDMAQFNDFSCSKVPSAYLRKQLVGVDKKFTSYGYKYLWGDFIIQSQNPLEYGSIILLKPTKKRTITLVT